MDWEEMRASVVSAIQSQARELRQLRRLRKLLEQIDTELDRQRENRLPEQSEGRDHA